MSHEFNTIKEKIGRLLFLMPELKMAHPNVRLFEYWKHYDGFGETTLYPKEITNYMSIDRAFRVMIPDEYKNRIREKECRDYFARSKEEKVL